MDSRVSGPALSRRAADFGLRACGPALGAIGHAVWGEGSTQAQQWTQQQCHALKHCGPRAVLAELLQHQVADPSDDVLTTNLTYLTKRVGQVQYPTYQAQGWPIGSGMVESANKLVVEARLKGSGMHWARDNVNAMLAVRNVVCNDRWAEGWAQMQARRRPTVGARRHARQQRARAAIVPRARSNCRRHARRGWGRWRRWWTADRCARAPPIPGARRSSPTCAITARPNRALQNFDTAGEVALGGMLTLAVALTQRTGTSVCPPVASR